MKAIEKLMKYVQRYENLLHRDYEECGYELAKAEGAMFTAAELLAEQCDTDPDELLELAYDHWYSEQDVERDEEKTYETVVFIEGIGDDENLMFYESHMTWGEIDEVIDEGKFDVIKTHEEDHGNTLLLNVRPAA